MVAAELQRKLVKEIGDIVKDIQMKTTAGTIRCGANGFEQQLPAVTEDEEDPDQFFPYYIVRLEDGNTEEGDDPWTVAVAVLFGVFDDDKSNKGHRHIMEMIQRIINRFNDDPLLKPAFRAKEKMDWALAEEDMYPYYFGGLEIKFDVPKIERSEPKYEHYC